MNAAKVATMACPTDETLTAFTLGEPIELASAADIATHIDTCPQCTTFVGDVVEKVVEWGVPEPTEAEAAALDEDIEASWRDSGSAIARSCNSGRGRNEMRKHRLAGGHIIIATSSQLWQTWRKYRPERLPSSWRVWALSGVYGIQPPSPIEYHRLERRQVVALAERVAQQWNASVAASVVMAGGELYQEVAIRARINVVQRINGRNMRKELATFAAQLSA